MNVYDFDNTIYDGESALDFFKFYLRRDPSLLRFVPRVLKAFRKYKKGEVTIERALSDYAGEVEDYYRKMTDADDAVREFWDAHIKNIKPFYYELHRDDDLIITASPDVSMKEICSRLGVTRCICTTFDSETGKIDRLCFRENKVKAYFEIYGDTPIENFYTDSLNDSPLIEISENAFLVKGGRMEKIK